MPRHAEHKNQRCIWQSGHSSVSFSCMLSSCKLVGGRCPDRRLVNPEGGGIRRAQRPKMQVWPPQQNLKKVPQTELQGDPWIDFTPVLCPFEEKEFKLICLLLPRWPGFLLLFLILLLFLFWLDYCSSVIHYVVFVLSPAVSIYYPLILYAYRHHGLRDWGRDLFEPFEEIQVRFLCAGALSWFNLVANRMIGWCFWENRVVCILDSFDKCPLDSGF